MLLPISNVPRDYAWGSTTLLAELEGREPAGGPEAEIWFGDHVGWPSRVEDGSGRTLDVWLAEEGAAAGVPGRLPFLLKLLAAGAPLSIQVHPSRAQAEEGADREDAAGIPADAGHRNYKDRNHKPELVVALSERFEALAGLRDVSETARLLAAMGDAPAARRLARRVAEGEPRGALRDAIGWLLSGEASGEIEALVAEARAAAGTDAVRAAGFEGELDLVLRLAEAYPGDPGVVIALLMNRVVLAAGEALFVGAGVLHAYVAGLGVELMAASDNVLRGGLTPKHVDVGQLLRIADTTPAPPPVLPATPLAPGVDRFDPGIPDFALDRVRVSGSPVRLDLPGPAIVVATRGAVRVADAGGERTLRPGRAVLAAGDDAIVLDGDGEAFVAHRGS